MKLAAVNIEGRNHIDRVLAFLRNDKPDVVCLQELYEGDVSFFEHELGMKSYYAPITEIKHVVNPRLDTLGKWGIGIFSKELSDTETFYYVDSSGKLPTFSGSPEGINYAVIAARCTVAGAPYDIATTHFTWSAEGKKSDQQLRDMQVLIGWLKKRNPDIICGDFNAPRGGVVRNMLAGIYKENIPPDVETTIDNELHKEARETGGIHLVVDGMFSSPNVSVSNVRVVSGVSDHCAVAGEVTRLS